MARYRLLPGLVVCAVCGCAFAGGLLGRGAAPDKAAAGGVLVATPAAAVTALVYFARRRVGGPNQVGSTPNQALHLTPPQSWRRR